MQLKSCETPPWPCNPYWFTIHSHFVRCLELSHRYYDLGLVCEERKGRPRLTVFVPFWFSPSLLPLGHTHLVLLTILSTPYAYHSNFPNPELNPIYNLKTLTLILNSYSNPNPLNPGRAVKPSCYGPNGLDQVAISQIILEIDVCCNILILLPFTFHCIIKFI